MSEERTNLEVGPTAKVCQKIFNVMKGVEHLKKDGKVEYTGANYQYLSEEKITENIRVKMIEQMLVAFPVKIEDIPNGDNMDKIIVTYKITDTVSGQYVFVQVMGCGKDSGDKKAYKAMTGAFKYFQRQTFFISTGDDPDKDASAKTNKDIGSKPQSKAKAYPKDHNKWEYSKEPVTPDYWDNPEGRDPKYGHYKGDDGKWYFKRKKENK